MIGKVRVIGHDLAIGYGSLKVSSPRKGSLINEIYMSDATDAPRSNGSFSMLQSLVRTIHVNDAHSAGNC